LNASPTKNSPAPIAMSGEGGAAAIAANATDPVPPKSSAIP